MKTNKKFKLLGLVICCVLIIGAVTGGVLVHATQSNQNYIGEEKAKAIALEHAGLSENEVSFALSKLDFDDRVAQYEVEFWDDSTEYDYEIDAVTGDIRSFDHDIESNINNTVSQQQSNIESQNYIGEEKAKAIALEHAGLSESEASFAFSKLDFDDRVAQYEVEFWNDSTEYDYEIDAVTGDIRSFDHDVESNMSGSQAPTPNNGANASIDSSEYITQEQAKSIALEDASTNASDVTYIKCEFDYDDGRPEYEVEWNVGGTEYEYNISAVDGSILERDVEQNG